MAIDFGEVFESLHAIQTKIDEIRQIAQVASDGGVTVPYIGLIEFTPAQKTVLKDEYDALKAEIGTLWQGLP
jgi:hypothetical protein